MILLIEKVKHRALINDTRCFVKSPVKLGGRNDSQNILRYVSPRDYWSLEGGSREQRTLDWLACGGTSNGGIHTFNLGRDARINHDVLAERHAGVQSCMLKKSYQYIGGCTQYNMHWPACGVP